MNRILKERLVLRYLKSCWYLLLRQWLLSCRYVTINLLLHHNKQIQRWKIFKQSHQLWITSLVAARVLIRVSHLLRYPQWLDQST